MTGRPAFGDSGKQWRGYISYFISWVRILYFRCNKKYRKEDSFIPSEKQYRKNYRHPWLRYQYHQHLKTTWLGLVTHSVIALVSGTLLFLRKCFILTNLFRTRKTKKLSNPKSFSYTPCKVRGAAPTFNLSVWDPRFGGFTWSSGAWLVPKVTSKVSGSTNYLPIPLARPIS